MGKSKLFTLPMATVKNRIWKKNDDIWLKLGGRGNVPGAERSTSGQDTEANGLLFTKTGLDYEQ